MSPGQMDSQSSDIKLGRRLRASGVALVNWTLMSGFKLNSGGGGGGGVGEYGQVK